MSRPSNRIVPLGGSIRRSIGAPGRGLAGARLADQAERLAASRCRSETSSTAWTTSASAPEAAAADREADRRGARPRPAVRRAARRRLAGGASTARAAHGRHGSAGPIGCQHADRRRRSGAARGAAQAIGRERAARLRTRSRPAGRRDRAARRRSTTSRGDHDVEPRRRAQQARRVGMAPASAKSVVGAARLDDPPGVHHRDPVAQAGDHAEVVGDQQHREAESLLQVGEQLEDLRLDRDVERGRRLVGDQQLAARRRAPSRSARAGACRPRSRAGTA